MTCMAINDTTLLVFSIIFTFLQLLITGLIVSSINLSLKRRDGRFFVKKLRKKLQTDKDNKKAKAT